MKELIYPSSLIDFPLIYVLERSKPFSLYNRRFLRDTFEGRTHMNILRAHPVKFVSIITNRNLSY